QRLTTLLGLTKQKDPVKIERDLMALVPRDKWTWFSHTLILHGRRVCIARRPKCEICVINRLCPSSRVLGFCEQGADDCPVTVDRSRTAGRDASRPPPAPRAGVRGAAHERARRGAPRAARLCRADRRREDGRGRPA